MEEKNQSQETPVASNNDECARIKQQYAYLQADFDNYRKRIDAQRSQWSVAAQAEVLTPVLDLMDDFDRAQGDINNPAFDLMVKSLKKILTRFNVTEITENTQFNPSLHEAIMQTPAPSPDKTGTIAQVLQKGYRFSGVILRPAKVAVYE